MLSLFNCFTHSWQLAEEMYANDTDPRSVTRLDYAIQCVGFFQSMIPLGPL